MIDVSLTLKCNECEKDLPLYDFGFSPTRGVHFSKCKECTNSRRKHWYQKDPNCTQSAWKKNKRRRP